MTLTISIPPEDQARLESRAADRGQDVATYVSELISHFAAKPTRMEELSGPIYQAFLGSGMTDDELGDLLERAKHEARADRRARGRT